MFSWQKSQKVDSGHWFYFIYQFEAYFVYFLMLTTFFQMLFVLFAYQIGKWKVTKSYKLELDIHSKKVQKSKCQTKKKLNKRNNKIFFTDKIIFHWIQLFVFGVASFGIKQSDASPPHWEGEAPDDALVNIIPFLCHGIEKLISGTWRPLSLKTSHWAYDTHEFCRHDLRVEFFFSSEKITSCLWRSVHRL